ncbi:MAG: hypothetical protein SA339_05045 [Methanomassiliicoccus sp.]|nr:hypothetical protein [Methanomassiliicoccus sp.]
MRLAPTPADVRGPGSERKKTATVVTLALLATLFLSLSLGAGTASATTLNGWSSHTGPDYELYMANSDKVGPYELVELINYDVHAITLQLWQVNGSMIQSESVDPASSKIIELDYGSVDCRIDVVNSYYGLEGSYNRYHYYEMLPQVSDNGNWGLSPPTSEDSAKIYSADDVASMLTSAFLENIVQTAIALSIGVIVGAAIKHVTRFWRPKDFLSMGIFSLAGADVFFNLSPWGWVWSIVFVVGYILGFMLRPIDSATPLTVDPQAKTFWLIPEAVYWPKDTTGCCIQDQTNRALFKRLVFGIHHRLETDVGITSDWTVVAQKPGRATRMKFRMFVVEKTEQLETIRKGWILKYREITTRFKIGYASRISLIEFLVDINNYYRIQDQHEDKASRLAELELRRRTDAADTAARYHEMAMQVSPLQAPKKIFARYKDATPLIETPWHTFKMKDTTATIAPVQVKRESEQRTELLNDKEPEQAEEEEPREGKNGSD